MNITWNKKPWLSSIDNQMSKPCIEYLNIPKGENDVYFITQSEIIFILNGAFEVTFREFESRLITKNKAVLFPPACHFKSEAKEDSSILIFRINNVAQFSKCFSQSNLFAEKSTFEYNFDLLDINNPLSEYLDGIQTHLANGIDCSDFFALKIKELTCLLMIYYPKNELLGFFYPLLNNDMEFTNFILSNHANTKTIKELADLSAYSMSGFVKRFKKVFGVSPHQWVKEQKVKNIFQDIVNSEKLFKEICYEHEFSSPSHFNDFCKANFGETPGELRKKILQVRLQEKTIKS